MSSPDQIKLKALTSNDMHQALEWWAHSSEEDKLLVWAEIQRLHNDPVQEVLSRFAQLGFTAVALEAQRRKDGKLYQEGRN